MKRTLLMFTIALIAQCAHAGLCDGDLDGDGDTDSGDLNVLLGEFGCVGGAGAPCVGDLDGDDDTDSADLNILLGGFGCAPPLSDCCEANGTPGCSDGECTGIMCSLDKFCCLVEWDEICGNQAQALCPICGGTPPPTGACCLTDGGCTEFFEVNCFLFGGAWQGPGTSCDTPGVCDKP